jgi:DNA-binding PucR family transcriptional regulator
VPLIGRTVSRSTAPPPASTTGPSLAAAPGVGISSERTSLTTTVRELVAHPGLRLRLVASASEQDREIRSVHTTDLQHPGRYVLPGELVLTNGLWFEEVPAEAWISDVGHAGAAALGFGLGTPHERIPPDVADACERRAIPLIEVPEDLSFVSISDAIAAADAEDQRSVMRQHLERSRAMVHGLSEGRGIAFLLDVLRDATGLDAALVAPSGHVLAATGRPPSADQARGAAATARRHRLPSEIEPGLTAFGSTGHGHPAAPMLVVQAAPPEIDDEVRIVINQVTDHVELESGRRRSERQSLLSIAQELVDRLRTGDVSAQALAARISAVGLDPERSITILAFAHDIGEVADALEAVGGPFALAPQAETVIALAQPSDGDALSSAASAIVEMGGQPTIGAGRAGMGATDLARSLREAVAALGVARSRPPGDRVVDHRDLGSHALLLTLLDPEIVRGFREQVLGPVERWDRGHRTTLVPTLRAFLSSGGRHRATAASLHIHHNTLRYRLRRVEVLTGRDLAVAEDRLDLQIALAVPADPAATERDPAGR